MKKLAAILIALGALALSPLSADPASKPSNPATSSDYALTTCVVSGEALGSMGKPVEYIHKEAGKPDRLVKFCCRGCVKDFKKDPAKFLAKIDEAEKARSNASK